MKLPSGIRSKLAAAIVIILIVIGVILNSYALMRFTKQASPTSLSNPTPAISQKQGKTQSSPISTTSESNSQVTVRTSGEPKLGHFPYKEARIEQLIIGSYAQGENQRFERLAPEAAQAMMKLIYAARDKGIWIVPVSGFRSIADQEKLFQAQIQHRGSPEEAAKVSAPPGYSEHHTGYAIDLADGHFPRDDITYKFAETSAFQWLSLHAEEFGFEMSFLENNAQGVSYEPWHWRFVDSSQASEIFRRSKLH